MGKNPVTELTFHDSAKDSFAKPNPRKIMNKAQLNRLCELGNEIETLRKQLGVSAPGEMLFQAARSMWSEMDVVVEADGRGGAKLLIVEGNYPADYTTHRTES